MNNFSVLICIVEYVGAYPSSDLPRGGPTRQLLWLFGVNFLLSAPVLSLVSLLSLDIKLGSLICLYSHSSPKGHLFTWNQKQIGVVVFDSMECILTVRFIGAAPAEASSRVRTSSSCNCCSWQLSAVILNASLKSLHIELLIYFCLAWCCHLCCLLSQVLISNYLLRIESVWWNPLYIILLSP